MYAVRLAAFEIEAAMGHEDDDDIRDVMGTVLEALNVLIDMVAEKGDLEGDPNAEKKTAG
jgi:hypothetical protein